MGMPMEISCAGNRSSANHGYSHSVGILGGESPVWLALFGCKPGFEMPRNADLDQSSQKRRTGCRRAILPEFGLDPVPGDQVRGPALGAGRRVA
jgi:hypothetical protein